jgi:hypothetical protein
MIPAGDDIEGIIVEEDIGWILVVEKEVLSWSLEISADMSLRRSFRHFVKLALLARMP